MGFFDFSDEFNLSGMRACSRDLAKISEQVKGIVARYDLVRHNYRMSARPEDFFGKHYFHMPGSIGQEQSGQAQFFTAMTINSVLGFENGNSKTLELDGKAIIKEMTSSDYAHAINVFEKNFGDFVDIVLPSHLSAQDLADSREREKKKVLQKNLTSEVLAGAYLR